MNVKKAVAMPFVGVTLFLGILTLVMLSPLIALACAAQWSFTILGADND